MKKRSEEQWRELFAQHDTSGVSAAEFCKRHNLFPKYFSLHRKQLYGLEKAIKDKTPAEKYQLRQTQSLPILQKIKTWLDKSVSHAPPQTLIGKALHYLHEQRPKLIRYVDLGDYPIDNNAAENAIRPFVIGRKNWLFSTSTKGAVAIANLYSVIETAKTNGLEPYGYLRKIFTELPQTTTPEQVEMLLPWNCKDVVG